MQYLYRPEAPAILGTFDYKKDKWDRISTSKKDLIWINLTQMQGNRCAYCQGKIKKHERHIEHFIKRDNNISLAYVWSNLFGSCKRKDGCGFYKDDQKFDPKDILKPDRDDPSTFFHFLSTGRLTVNDGLDRYNERRAKETIRVFNLDPEVSPMRYQREQAISNHSHLFTAMLVEMNLFVDLVDEETIEDCNFFLKETLDAYRARIIGIPFETAVLGHMRSVCAHLFL